MSTYDSIDMEQLAAARAATDRALAESATLRASLSAVTAERDEAREQAAHWKADAAAVHYSIPGAESRLISERDAARQSEGAARERVKGLEGALHDAAAELDNAASWLLHHGLYAAQECAEAAARRARAALAEPSRGGGR